MAAMDYLEDNTISWIFSRCHCSLPLLPLGCDMKEALEATKVLKVEGAGLRGTAFKPRGLNGHPVVKRLRGISEPVVTKSQERGVYEQWEASDNFVIHKIQDLNETGFGETHAALTFKEICRIDPVSTHYESTEKFVDDESTEEAKTRRVNGKRSREAAVAQQRSGRKGSARIAHELYAYIRFNFEITVCYNPFSSFVAVFPWRLPSPYPRYTWKCSGSESMKTEACKTGLANRNLWKCFTHHRGQGQNASNRGRSSIFQDERVEPHYLSSSIFYGAQDVYSNQSTARSSVPAQTYKKDGENDDPYGSASRGNWRQGSLYY
ncbi:hypothetical protein IFM89_004856 [Coptis chinensis]|uniref:Uncharacterized protein n=1 Tax=Coptis chinensis TaxID=261450 RepID=A0A835H4P9_9MAGN|nr:hypothetical protein IFM89_004856 [Coptis chinensis]